MDAKLLKFQVPHFYQLLETFNATSCVLDASDTGTGKTYVAIALCAQLKLSPFVICPKSVIPNWTSVAKMMGVTLFGISNYEMLKGCKYYTQDLECVDCPYMDKVEKIDDKGKKVKEFQFNIPNDTMVIFDEAHRCKNYASITSKLFQSICRSSKITKYKILLLSATISDKIDCFKPFGVAFGFYDDTKKFKMWLRKQIKAKEVHYNKSNKKPLTHDQMVLDIIHNQIFPAKGSRMKIKELGDMFPSNQVLAQAYMCVNKEKIQEQYDIIEDAFMELKNKELRSEALGKLVMARMKIEMFKMPIMLDIIEEALDSNYSVAIFVNYVDTMNYLAHYFETDCLIYGGQALEDRQDSIDAFQSNKSKIIIAIMQAGGVGISLHDIHGGHPRMSVISPTWSGQDMQQVLGRIHRAGGQSPALQRIIYCGGTYEEQICKIIDEKLKNISGINDGDLIGPKFTEESYEEIEEDIKKIEADFHADTNNDDLVNHEKDTNSDSDSNKDDDDDSDSDSGSDEDKNNIKKDKIKEPMDEFDNNFLNYEDDDDKNKKDEKIVINKEKKKDEKIAIKKEKKPVKKYEKIVPKEEKKKFIKINK